MSVVEQILLRFDEARIAREEARQAKLWKIADGDAQKMTSQVSLFIDQDTFTPADQQLVQIDLRLLLYCAYLHDPARINLDLLSRNLAEERAKRKTEDLEIQTVKGTHDSCDTQARDFHSKQIIPDLIGDEANLERRPDIHVPLAVGIYLSRIKQMAQVIFELNFGDLPKENDGSPKEFYIRSKIPAILTAIHSGILLPNSA